MICETTGLKVTEVNHVEELEALRLTWNALLAETAGRSFFHTLDWLKAYWAHFGEGQKLRTLVVSADNKPIGILPLTVITESTRLGNVRVLTYPLHDWGTFFGPIGPNPTATLTVAMRYLRSRSRDWDVLDLRWVDRDGDDHCRTEGAMEQAGLVTSEAAWKTTAIIDLSEGWDSYWASRKSRLRSEMRRRERKIEEAGQLEHVRYRPMGSTYGDGEPRWDLYDACETIARGSWQGSSTSGTTITHPQVREFFRESHALAAKNGMLDVSLLTLDHQPVAYSYNYVCDGRVTGIRVGYLPEYAKYGVGNLMSLHLIRDSIERGDTNIDMGIGTLDIKRRWATRLATSYHYTHYPRLAPRAQLLRLKRWSDSHRRQAEALA